MSSTTLLCSFSTGTVFESGPQIKSGDDGEDVGWRDEWSPEGIVRSTGASVLFRKKRMSQFSGLANGRDEKQNWSSQIALGPFFLRFHTFLPHSPALHAPQLECEIAVGAFRLVVTTRTFGGGCPGRSLCERPTNASNLLIVLHLCLSSPLIFQGSIRLLIFPSERASTRSS